MDGLEQARSLLPGWIGWAGPVSYLLLALAASALGARAAVALGLRGYDAVASAHWTERARLSWVARSASALCLLMLPAVFAVSAHLWVGPFSAVPELALALTAALACATAVIAEHLRLLRRVLIEPPGLGYWLQGALVLWLVIRPGLPLIALLALLAPAELWSAAMVPWAVFGLLLLLLAMRGSTLRLGSALGLVRPASARLRHIIERAAERVGLKPKAAYELRWPMVNAAAYPAGGVLVFSDAALRHLDDAQLEAVTAHELGHLSEPKRIVALRGLQALVWLPLAAVRPIEQSYGWSGFLLVLAFAFVLTISLRRTMRRMEQRADAQAAEDGATKAAYAGALEALYRTNGLPAVMGRHLTHPQLYDRLTEAGHPPDYPRPKPPPRARAYVGMLVAAVLAVFCITAGVWAPALAERHAPDEDWPVLLSLAAGHGGGWELGVLADRRAERGELDEAIALYRVIARQPDAHPSNRVRLVGLLTQAGRCDEAAAVLAELDQLGPAADWLEEIDWAREMVAVCRHGASSRR